MYKAPIDDLDFVLNKIIDLQAINKLPGFEEVTNDLINQVLIEADKVSVLLSESNHTGDQISSKRNARCSCCGW